MSFIMVTLGMDHGPCESCVLCFVFWLLFFVINTQKSTMRGIITTRTKYNLGYSFFLTAIRLALVVLATTAGSTGVVSLGFSFTLLE